MCLTSNSEIDDMDVISSTSQKKTGKHIEPRKIRKPLMEKKRRARINQSLDELKRIVVDAHKFAGQDLSRVNKLEKADILEMTVRYLKRKATPPADVYLAGYRQCIEQVQELLAEQWTDERRQLTGRRMVEHLELCVQQLNVPSQIQKNRPPSTSSFSDEYSNKVRNNSFSTLSSDEDSVEEEQLVIATPVATSPSLPATNHTTNFQNNPPKSTWRPW